MVFQTTYLAASRTLSARIFAPMITPQRRSPSRVASPTEASNASNDTPLAEGHMCARCSGFSKMFLFYACGINWRINWLKRPATDLGGARRSILARVTLDVHENVLRKWVKEFSSSVKATSQTGRTLTALADAWHTHSLSRGIRPRDAKRWKGVVLRFKDWLFPPVGGAGFPCAADRPASA